MNYSNSQRAGVILYLTALIFGAYDVIEINKSITNKITECEIRDFIDMVGNNGQTFMPGLMNGARKNENFAGQQVYGLDFDEGITFEEFMERAEELELYPAFVYKTFDV